jgi:ribonuclease Z
MRKVNFTIIVVLCIGIGLGLMLAHNGIQKVKAAGGVVKNPAGTAPDRYVYYPGTEKLGPDEMRVVACGTGMPAARHRQAATCFLVELGNGDKFLFDLGTHSMGNVSSLMIPFDYLDKVFLSHLHTDHWGDLPTLWAGGWTSGRTGPLKIWGPSGKTKDMGTVYAIEHFLKAFNWDNKTRIANLNNKPGQITVKQFDYTAENEIIYQENGVTIRSWPAIHAGDGSVSLSLEWNGLKFVFGGDSMPNKWYIKYAQDADLAIHECFLLPDQLVRFYGQAPTVALNVGTFVHTSPEAFGKIMSTIKPRHAVAYHFFNEEATRYEIYEGIRSTYDGPVSLANDLMVWNITKGKITERMAAITEEAWSVPGPAKPPANEATDSPLAEFSKEILSGKWDVTDAQSEMIDGFKKKYGIKDKAPKR